ncbi:hypothetical protein GWI33_017591 [Rhynchophorus ferrugineus]|uniref:Uncharacterized protein n=1 Tax=Rhynchophorus ferrugineus TaxID=354439 RepID=A0A834HY69_RHYFE|nr:hypothetical protein GWI33_017591 [Rhynchophorus ferrugineus]
MRGDEGGGDLHFAPDPRRRARYFPRSMSLITMSECGLRLLKCKVIWKNRRKNTTEGPSFGKLNRGMKWDAVGRAINGDPKVVRYFFRSNFDGDSFVFVNKELVNIDS